MPTVAIVEGKRVAKNLVPRSQLRGMTKKERQQYVRALRRAERERLARQKRQRRVIGWSAAGAGLLVVGVAITVSAVSATASAEPTATPAAVVGPANMASDGLLLTGDGTSVVATTTAALTEGEDPTATVSDVATTGVLDVQVYLDPTTTDAATLWSTIGDTLREQLIAGAVTLELHPVEADTSSLDAVSAVAGFGCAADLDPDAGLDVWDALLAQTAASGLTSDDVPTVIQSATTDATDVATCMSAGTYTTWADEATARAEASVPYTATAVDITQGPVVVAAGTVYTGALDDLDAFTTFLSDAYPTS